MPLAIAATPHYLAIETSSPRLSLAVGDDTKILARYEGPLHWRHADTLFGALEKLMKKVGWTPRRLTGVAVSTGPGSFTGIRIGLAAARALGQALSIPVVGVSSLETLARPLAGTSCWISPAIDALRGDVFAAVFAANGKGRITRLVKEAKFSKDEWLTHLQWLPAPQAVWVTGDALKLYGQDLRAPRLRRAEEKLWYPQAASLLEIARVRLLKASKDSYRRVHPLYLRQAAAQERLSERHAAHA